MKTSNRILLGMMAAIVFYVTAAFVELRFKGDSHPKSHAVETAPIPAFSHLVINGMSQHVEINYTDSASFEWMSASGISIEAIDFEMKGDTLIMNGLITDENQHMFFAINTGPEFRSLNSLGSSYTIKDFDQDSLLINQQGGRGIVSDARNLAHLDLTVEDRGEFDIYDRSLESVNLHMVNSNVEMRSPVATLNGSMEQNSYLSLSGVQSFQFRKDASSRLKHYE